MKKLFVLTLLLGVVFGSCEKLEITSGLLNSYPLVTTLEPVKEVNHDIVCQIAEKYASSFLYSRGNNENKVKEIIPLKNNQSEILLYIVNYENDKGFIIVSGNNECQPILAYGTTGNIDAKKIKNSGLSLWLSEQQYAIKNVKLLPDSTRMQNRRAWNKFFEKNTPVKLAIKSRSGDSDLENQVGTYIEESLNEWSNDGYDIYPYGDGSILDELFSSVDVNTIKDYLASDAEDRFLGGWSSTVYIRVKKNVVRKNMNPLLQSSWGQKAGYNNGIPNKYPVGCCAVAVGQIMRYHEYPISYNWQLMNYNYPTDITAEFLYDVAEKMHTKYGEDVSTSTIDNSCKALREYGYNSTVTSHHYATVEKQLKNKMPVFMMGIKPGEKIGHAWVCDGFLSDTENAHYEVMVIDKTTMDMENRPYYR